MKKVNEEIIIELIKSKAETSENLDSVKRKILKKYKQNPPTNMDLLKIYHSLVKIKRISPSKNLELLLRKRPIRSLSGIINISVLTKAYSCPGKCVFCPTQKDMPKSYLNNEPAVMRAILNKFDPYKQVRMRIRALTEMGHPVDKVELRIVGGTWSYYPKQYQTWFIKRCFDACNSKDSKTLKESQTKNEKAKIRIIGIHMETRPDFINEKEIKRLRSLGVTGCELGVQTIYDDVLKLTKRGHKIKETITATKFLKDAGIKVCYQIMPNLTGSTIKKDREMFKTLFSNENFQPDYLKIYPCVVLKESKLYSWYKEGKHKVYKEKDLANLLKDIKKEIPYYVRIQRVIRDIPTPSIIAGCKISNLRQFLKKDMEENNWQCKCIRCREIKEIQSNEKLNLFRMDYNSSEGKEIFLSFENKGRTKLYSLLRLRIPSTYFKNEKHFLNVLDNSGIIREIHTYGQMQSINKNKEENSPQHKGLGKKLVNEAETILKKEFNIKKIAIISGIGVREYYKKLGYKLKDTYMIKNI